MQKLMWFLFGMVIGLYVFNIFLINENKNIKKENAELKDDNQYLEWQLGEVPTIIESRKEEICN